MEEEQGEEAKEQLGEEAKEQQPAEQKKKRGQSAKESAEEPGAELYAEDLLVVELGEGTKAEQETEKPGEELGATLPSNQASGSKDRTGCKADLDRIGGGVSLHNPYGLLLVPKFARQRDYPSAYAKWGGWIEKYEREQELLFHQPELAVQKANEAKEKERADRKRKWEEASCVKGGIGKNSSHELSKLSRSMRQQPTREELGRILEEGKAQPR